MFFDSLIPLRRKESPWAILERLKCILNRWGYFYPSSVWYRCQKSTSIFHSRFSYFQLIKLSKEAIAWCSTLDLNLWARERCPECVEYFDCRRRRLTFSLIDSNIYFILNKVLSHPYVGVGRRRRNGAAEKDRFFLSVSQRAFNLISPPFSFLKARLEN